ncbi:MAG TPA: hypothetical protein VHV32_18905 [Candidatus Angelobacter sp.]|jgi:hypothetical protein|nr:hypothetical protein [Candidatus Angelobacter sp.]
MTDLSTSAFIRQLLTGSPTGGSANGGLPSNAFGSSGIDFANALAQAAAGGQIDPRLAQYFNIGSQGSETPTTTFTPNDPNGPSNQGTVMIDGVPYVQLAGATDNSTIRSRDPSMFRNDPKYGLITPASNVHAGTDWYSEIAPWLMVGGGIAGPALAAAAGGSSGLLGSMGPNDAYGGMTAANATDVPIGELPYSGLDPSGMGGMAGSAVADPTGMGAMGGASSSAAAPGGAMDMAGGMPGLAPQTLSGNLNAILSGTTSLGTGAQGLLGSLAQSAMSNPLQAIGLLQTGAGLLHNTGLLGGSHTTQQSGKSSNGTGVGNSSLFTSRPQWTPNPYTLRQLQQYGGGGL